jgi:hypothetical protein
VAVDRIGVGGGGDTSQTAAGVARDRSRHGVIKKIVGKPTANLLVYCVSQFLKSGSYTNDSFFNLILKSGSDFKNYETDV